MLSLDRIPGYKRAFEYAGGQVQEQPVTFKKGCGSDTGERQKVGASKLLYGNGCREGGTDCFSCLLPDCHWTSEWGTR